MERKGKFTRGLAEVSQTEPDAKVKTRAGYINVGDTLYHKENIANAALIASAFNAATACEDMGYDGESCVKALPGLVDGLEQIKSAFDNMRNESDTLTMYMEMRAAFKHLEKFRG